VLSCEQKFGSGFTAPTDYHSWLWVWGVGTFLTIAAIFAYGKVFAALVSLWWSAPAHSHGFLIPWISLYLIWVTRKSLFQIGSAPSYVAGSGILIFGLCMLVVGDAGGVITIQELSIFVTIIGLVLLLLGPHVLREIWFPILYLSFMTSLWGQILAPLQFPFQNFTATIAVTLLRFIGIPVYQQGILIELPNITLEVAKVCSGVGSLIALIAVGIPMANILLNGWLRKVILICSAVVFAIVANSLRVALIGVTVYYNLSENLHGPHEALQAFSVAVIGFGGLFAGVWILSKIPLTSASLLPKTHRIDEAVQHRSKKREIQYLGAGVFLLFLFVGSYLNFFTPSPVPLKTDLRYFPFQIGEWEGMDITPINDAYRILGVNHELSRTYRMTSGETIYLYIGYFESQEQGKELIGYKTKDLHLNASKIEVDLNSHSSIQINKRVVPLRGTLKNDEPFIIPSSPRVGERQGGGTLLLFWYDLNGRIVSNRYLAKVYTAWDALIHGKTNGAVIMLVSEFQNAEDLPKILVSSKAFSRKIWPLLQQYLPRS